MQPITTVAPKSKVALNEELLCMVVKWSDDFYEIDLKDCKADGLWSHLTADRSANPVLGEEASKPMHLAISLVSSHVVTQL